MKVHFGGRLFLAAAVFGAVVLMAAGFFAALAIRSALADPGGPVPNPGHAWTELQDHGIDGGDYWLGTTDTQALELRVNGERALRLEPNDTSPNVIGGHSSNAVTAGVVGAAIGGGGRSDPANAATANRVTDDYGTIGGGGNNQAGDNAGTTDDATYATVGGGSSNNASALMSTVGGGDTNTASGEVATVGGGSSNTASARMSTVGGGNNNTASGEKATVSGGWGNTAGGWSNTVGGGESNTASGGAATVGGGESNTASGGAATVGGGDSNTASGGAATVPGGELNTAQGEYSLAAGRRAKANNAGCFVWGDSTDTDIACNNNNRFIARASGGVYLYTNSTLTSGAYLAAGSGSWSTVSDRNLKDNFTPVDGQEVLASLADIPSPLGTTRLRTPLFATWGRWPRTSTPPSAWATVTRPLAP
jgi:hypothetical protein